VTGLVTNQPFSIRTQSHNPAGPTNPERTYCDTVGHMRENQQPSVQRSFRLSPRTLELLDAAAATSGESRNALADRLLGEGVRLERHPLIRFHRGAAGRRQPLVAGTRLYVHQIMSTLRASGRDIEDAAAYLGIVPRLVRAAVDYYAEFADEVDEDAAVAESVERDERARWERQQRALA
jgi:uncharacterized protein (DUF433 family)